MICDTCGHFITEDDLAIVSAGGHGEPFYDEVIGCRFCVTESTPEDCRDWDDVLRQRIEDGEAVL